MSMEVSHIWLGRFGPNAPETYFEEQYEEDAPLSQFVAEQGERWCDHDMVEISFLNDSEPVRSLVDGHSWSEAYIDEVATKAVALGVHEANVFVLADKEEFSNPRSVSGPDYQLWYLGTFHCHD